MTKVLIVDDDRLILATLAAGLRHAGYEVFEASSGEQALEQFSGIAPDLMVLDVRMGELSGLDVAERLQESQIPILFLTAYGDDKIVQNAIKYGAIGYLVKPIDVPQLIPVIETSLARAIELREQRAMEEHLRTALDQKRETSVAIGILMERHGMDSHQAFELMRQRARSQRRKMIEVAEEIVQAGHVLSCEGELTQKSL
ncbi:MAG: response regulator [Gammaproteobacteria bacterium]|nr:response regulator [Gammaproteobacteria bacterium]